MRHHNKQFIFLVTIFLLTTLAACSPISNRQARRVVPRPTGKLIPEAKKNDTLASLDPTATTPEDYPPPELNQEEDQEVSGEEVAVSEPEPDLSLEQEVQDLDALGWEGKVTMEDLDDPSIQYDFPVQINKQVKYYLDLFQTNQRNNFAAWLGRSSRYLPMIKQELQEAGLPLDLAYLPMIESGYSLTAVSKANAVGPWQFMAGTGRDYGLNVDKYVDERRDPAKSTKAAVAFLSDLYHQFNSWPLAVASYNAGGGKMDQAVKKYQTNNFWELAQGDFLAQETKRYVPKLIAAIIIARNPTRYGFTEIAYQEPLTFDSVSVPRATPLQKVALALNEPLEKIQHLNRELSLSITPPNRESYRINIPVGKREMLAQNLPRVHTNIVTEYKNHVVRPNESLAQIAKTYNLSKITLLKANNLQHAKLSTGQHIRVPIQVASHSLMAETKVAAAPAKRAPAPDGSATVHKIKAGETIAVIAKQYDVTPEQIADWNELEDINEIQVGQELEINNASPVVAKAPTPAKAQAAAKPQVVAKATAKKTTAAPGKKGKAVAATYKVRGGDNLWLIAQKYNVSTDEIKKINNLKDDQLQPGRQLLIPTEEG